MVRKLRITVEPAVYLLVAVSAMILPLRFVTAWFAATVVHEVCHCLAVWIFGNQLEHIHIGTGGMVIQTNPMCPWKGAVSAIAGPAGGLFLVFFGRQFPMLAVCALVQSIFNLLPLRSLDGERFLHCTISMFLKNGNASCLCDWIDFFTLILILGICLYGSFALKMGLLPVLFALSLILRQ
jgi:hypothetical protein